MKDSTGEIRHYPAAFKQSEISRGTELYAAVLGRGVNIDMTTPGYITFTSTLTEKNNIEGVRTVRHIAITHNTLEPTLSEEACITISVEMASPKLHRPENVRYVGLLTAELAPDEAAALFTIQEPGRTISLKVWQENSGYVATSLPQPPAAP